MVTHEARAASIADRILFLADGLIVKELTGASAGRVLEVMSTLQVVTRVALKGLLGRKLRALLTAIAVVLGVAMVSGTYILTDTIKAAFSTVFTRAYKHADAVITGKSAIGTDNNNGSRALPPSLPASLLAQVQALPQVALASGGSRTQAGLVGHNGKVIARGGAPGLAFSYTPAGQRFSPLTPGQRPLAERPGRDRHRRRDRQQAALLGRPADRRRRARARAAVHDRRHGQVRRRLLARRRHARAVHAPDGPATLQQAGPVRPDQRRRQARGTSPQQLVRTIRPLLPPNSQVRTGQGQAAQATKDTSGFLTIFQDFLLAFGGVALFVGSFVIANTLSITIAQRTRELATLRTLGATRRQVLGSVMLEALVIGLLASIVGLFLGLALAKGLNSLLVSFGIDLPQTGTVFKTRTIVVSLVVGVVITLLAALRPAIRSTRVPPIAAVREGAVLPPSRFARFGTAGGDRDGRRGGRADARRAVRRKPVHRARGCSPSGSARWRCSSGVAMLAPRLVPPLAEVLGWPATRFGGAAGKLARSNATRNPARTASTASALMIGLALVTLVGVLAAGLRSRFEGAVNQLFVANYAVTATNNFTPISTASEQRAPHAFRACRRLRRAGRATGRRSARGSTSPAWSRT